MQKRCREAIMSNRKTLIRFHKYIILACMLLALLGACASVYPPPGSPSPENEKGFFQRSPSDADIFLRGMSYLGNGNNVVDYAKAREAFNEMLKRYPDSKWRNLTEKLIRLIDDTLVYREKSESQALLFGEARGEKTRLAKENEQLKKDNRQLLEETAKLLRENEQLKKDIQLLKSLELELQKREKMLR